MERDIATFACGDVPDVRDPAARGVLARIRSEAASRKLGSPRLYVARTVATAIVFGSGFPMAFVLGMRSLRVAPIVGLLIFIFALAGGGLVSVWLAMRAAGLSVGSALELVVAALLRMARCASCGYPIDASAADANGLVRCPECGAAWRADRIGRESVPPAPPASATMARSAIVSSALARTRRRDDRGRPWSDSSLPWSDGGASTRWRDLVSRPLWPSMLLACGLIVGGLGLAIVILAQSAGAVSAVVAAAAIFLLLLAAGIVTLARAKRETIRRRLRIRSCLACACRLRRDGDFLVCTRCDAAWRHPKLAANARTTPTSECG
ncbi:MAG: hypothetical protein U0572_07260 [Phycisphaerales bacterium]